MTSRRTDALFKAAASLALLITIGLGVFMIRTNNAERDTAAWVVHTLEVTAQISKTQASTTNETNARRGYLLFGDEFFANEMEKAAAEAQQHLIQLNRLTQDNAGQQSRINMLEAKGSELLALGRLSIAAYRESSQNMSKQAELMRGTRLLHEELASTLDEMAAHEEVLLRERTSNARAANRLARRVILIGIAFTILLLSLMLFQLASERSGRRDSEQHFRLLVEGAQDYAIFMLDLNGHISSWNLGAERITGYRADEIVGKHFSIFFPASELKLHKPSQELKTALTEGLVVNEGWRLRKDGSRFWANATTSAVRDPQGRLLGFSKIERDRTESKRAESDIGELNLDLNKRISELAAANQEMESFTYSVSHDLRAPLRHVQGFIKILVEDCAPQLDPTALSYLVRVEEGARRMAILIDELLGLARLGRQSLKWQITGMQSIVDATIVDLAPDLVDRKIEWKLGALPFVECDSVLIGQVLHNLLSNAIKYTRPRQKAVIEVGVDSTTPEGQPVIFVRDNGVGFNMKHSSHLFGVFQRLHRAEEFEGIGIGLATVQRIIQRHGGSIWADAEVDRGATFYFTLGSPATG